MMHIRFIGAFSALVLTATIAGCGEGDDPGGGGGDGKPRTVALRVQFLDARTQEPLEGLEVCAAERDDVPCAESDDEGRVAIDLPGGAEIMLACSIATHVPTYMTLTIPEEDFDVGVFRLIDTTTAGILAVAAGAKADPKNGIVLANVYEDLEDRDVRVSGATFSMTPKGGLGPVYAGPVGLPVKTLEASTEGGPAVFFELPPGERTVTIAHPKSACTAGFGFRTDSDKALRTKVFAGGMSTLTFVCPP